MFWGRGKPHVADSGLLCATFYRIRVHLVYLLPSRDCLLEGKGLGKEMGNAPGTGWDSIGVFPADAQSAAGGCL